MKDEDIKKLLESRGLEPLREVNCNEWRVGKRSKDISFPAACKLWGSVVKLFPDAWLLAYQQLKPTKDDEYGYLDILVRIPGRAKKFRN